MRGFPKHINTKEDVKNLLKSLKEHGKLKDYRKEIRGVLKSWQADRMKWFPVKVLAKGEAGIEDATHKIIITEEVGITKRIQYELKNDPKAKMIRLGITKKEILEMVKSRQ